MAFDFLTESDFKGDVNEIESAFTTWTWNDVEQDDGIIQSFGRSTKRKQKLKEEVALLKTLVVSNEANEGDEDMKTMKIE